MNIIENPLGLGHIVHMGSKEEAGEHQRVLNARGEFAKKYAKENGWGEDLEQLSMQQIMEIRKQEGWKNP